MQFLTIVLVVATVGLAWVKAADAATLLSITVSPTAASLAAGETQPFTATGHYSDLSTANLTDTVTWSTSSSSTATVSNTSGSQGLATAVGTGAATITATDGLILGTALMTVTPATLLSITVSPTAASVAAGETQQFTATGHYSDLSTANLTDTVTWSTSSSSTATVSNTSGSQGLATAVGTGAATITASDPSSPVNGTALMTVTPAVLLTITVSPTAASVQQFKTVQFTATGHYSDLSTANLTNIVTWSSSSTGTATISNASGSRGLATGKTTGGVTITASDPSALVSGTALLTVTAAPPPSLTISPTSGPKRTLLRIKGTNFAPGDVVTVKYMSGLANPKRAHTALCIHHADSSGSFTCSGQVPRKRRSGTAGQKSITATDASGRTASVTFTLQ